MIGAQVTQDQVKSAIVADVFFSPGAGDEWKMILFTNNIIPSRNTVFADLIEASFTGYARKSCGAGPVVAFKDPLVGNWQIRLKVPLGGFFFATSAVPETPVTVYGFAMLAPDEDVVLAIERFATPKVLSTILAVVDVCEPILNLPLEIFS